MHVEPIAYQCSFFADMQPFEPTADVVSTLLGVLGKRGFLPTTYQEVDLSSPRKPITRIRFTTPEDRWAIDFETTRIRVDRACAPADQERDITAGAFVEQTSEMVKPILETYSLTSSRLALVSNFRISAMTTPQITSAYSKLCKPLPLFEQDDISGWTLRTLARPKFAIGGRTELINLIAVLTRPELPVGAKPESGGQDSIHINFDINTHQSEKLPRFEFDGATAFFSMALESQERLVQQILERLKG